MWKWIQRKGNSLKNIFTSADSKPSTEIEVYKPQRGIVSPTPNRVRPTRENYKEEKGKGREVVINPVPHAKNNITGKDSHKLEEYAELKTRLIETQKKNEEEASSSSLTSSRPRRFLQMPKESRFPGKDIYHGVDGLPYISDLNDKTTLLEIGLIGLIHEGFRRQTIKITEDQKANIILEDNSATVVGKYPMKIKFSKKGYEEFKKFRKEEEQYHLSYKLRKEDEDQNVETDVDYFIAIAKSNPQFLLTAENTHMLCINIRDIFGKKKVYVQGFFTSDKSDTNLNLSPINYQIFQERKLLTESGQTPEKAAEVIPCSKPQRYTCLSNPRTIDMEDLSIVKYSKEYLDFINHYKIFDSHRKILDKVLPYPLEKNGVSKEEFLRFLKWYDKNVKPRTNYHNERDKNALYSKLEEEEAKLAEKLTQIMHLNKDLTYKILTYNIKENTDSVINSSYEEYENE
jgi:hypothetical protein